MQPFDNQGHYSTETPIICIGQGVEIMKIGQLPVIGYAALSLPFSWKWAIRLTHIKKFSVIPVLGLG
jgi:hypothetical protein